MVLSLLFGNRKSKKEIGGIEVDAFIEESITYRAQITSNPVDSGADITDHIIYEPVRLLIRGVIPSNKRSLSLILPFGGGNRQQEVYEDFKDLFYEGDLIEVVAGLEVFNNMLIESISIDRTPENASGLEFVMELKQIRLAGVTLNLLAGKANLGRVSTTAAAAADITNAINTLSLVG